MFFFFHSSMLSYVLSSDPWWKFTSPRNLCRMLPFGIVGVNKSWCPQCSGLYLKGSITAVGHRCGEGVTFHL